jgi:hypothetical protein
MPLSNSNGESSGIPNHHVFVTLPQALDPAYYYHSNILSSPCVEGNRLTAGPGEIGGNEKEVRQFKSEMKT